MFHYFWRGKQHKPIGVHNTAEASNECGGLLPNLRVHAEVRTVVDVVDSIEMDTKTFTSAFINGQNPLQLSVLLVIIRHRS